MNQPYMGEERRKGALVELLNRRVLALELQASQQAETLAAAVADMQEKQRKLTKELDEMKALCQGCPCFGDDYK